MIPMALAKRILREVDMDELDRERAAALARGMTFDAYVAARVEELKRAPRSHIYLAQLRNDRRKRERNIPITTPVDEPGQPPTRRTA